MNVERHKNQTRKKPNSKKKDRETLMRKKGIYRKEESKENKLEQ